MKKITNCPECGIETKEINLQDGRKGYVCSNSKKNQETGQYEGCSWKGAWESNPNFKSWVKYDSGAGEKCPKCNNGVVTKDNIKGVTMVKCETSKWNFENKKWDVCDFFTDLSKFIS